MKPFEDVWKLTDAIHGWFTLLSGQKLYEYALQVPHGSKIVEIGVDWGRSASILLAASEQTGADVWLVDKWESDEPYKSVKRVRSFFPEVRCPLFRGASVDVARAIDDEFNMIHIDADHFEGIAQDCEAWLPKLVSGGIACFHDYDSCFPAVNAAVDKYCAGWENLGVWDGLAIRRKP